jgi:hypothetical protein
MRRSLLLLALLCGPPASARPPQDMLASMIAPRAASPACGAGCACSRPGVCGHEGCDCVGFERTAARPRRPAAPAYAPPAYVAPPYSAPPPYLTPPLRYLAAPAPAYYSAPMMSGGCAGGSCAAGFR